MIHFLPSNIISIVDFNTFDKKKLTLHSKRPKIWLVVFKFQFYYPYSKNPLEIFANTIKKGTRLISKDLPIAFPKGLRVGRPNLYQTRMSLKTRQHQIPYLTSKFFWTTAENPIILQNQWNKATFWLTTWQDATVYIANLLHSHCHYKTK